MSRIRSFLLAVTLVLSAVVAFAGGGVNINTADAATLEKSLKGVGPNKAQAIIAYREKHGPFPTLAAVTKVKGIGKKTVKKIADKAFVEQ